MYKELNRVESINGNVLRHNDETTELSYRFRDAAGAAVDLTDEDIRYIRLNHYQNKQYAVVDVYRVENNQVLFHLPTDMVPGTYYLEIKTTAGVVFPANDETKIILKNSSLYSEHQRISLYGFESVVDAAVSRINLDDYTVDEDKIREDVKRDLNYQPIDQEKFRQDIVDSIPLNRLVVNVTNHGAIGNGSQDERDAIQEVVNIAPEGSVVHFPSGLYLTDYVIFINKNIIIRGESATTTKIRVMDNSTLFHNDNRDRVDRNKQDGMNLFRDFHSVFFYVDCDVIMYNLEVDGNPEGQQDIVNGEVWNYVAPTVGDKSRDYYKYYHLVQVMYNQVRAFRIDIQGCDFHGGTWNNVVINNNTVVRNHLIDGRIFNNRFEGSAQDMLSLHFVSNLEVKANTFVNPNSHCLHSYYDTDRILVDSNYFVFTDDVNWIAPNKPEGRILEAMRFGHGTYKSHIRSQTFTNNVIDVRTDVLVVYGVVMSNTMFDAIVETNIMKNVTIGIFAQSVLLGTSSIKKNTITHKEGGIIHRPSLNNGTFMGVPDDVPLPISAIIDITDNSVRRLGNSSANADILVHKPNYNEAELRKYVVNLRDNKAATVVTDKSVKYDIRETPLCSTQAHEGTIQLPYRNDRSAVDVLKIENNPSAGRSDAFIYLDIVDSRRGLIQDVLKVTYSGATATVTRENIRGDTNNSHYQYQVTTDSFGLNTVQVMIPSITPATLKYSATSRTHSFYKR
ncbi:glycosyl hydrolase family 28-related protein [Salinicoccus sesuvii]|uniref:Glycosyl hydrolase family 28-related protein n=1 Tax=Salinicoccus sesuvii TaxID=868281 RepID=A0ABV7N3H2_9STAP